MSTSYIPREVREGIADQAKHRCGYCLTREEIVGTPMEIDHIIPEALGGATEEDNLWLACSLCNAHKSNRIADLDPETGNLTRLFDPRHQQWQEHFVWSSEGDYIVALTGIGRATMAALQLNRSTLVVARRLWVSVGWHPPED